MKVLWNARAIAELEASVVQIRLEDPGAARGLARAVLDAVDILADGRFDGPEIHLSDGRKARHWWVHPFHLLYRRQPGAVRILRLYHHARRPLWK